MTKRINAKNKKIDYSKNGDMESEPKGRNYPLVIDKRTTLYVTKDKCNEEYRQEWIKRTRYPLLKN